MLFLGRIAASVVIGWVLGATLGILVSKLAYDGKAGQLPIITVPLGIVITYLASFLFVRPR